MHIAATLKGLAKDILGFSVVDMQQPLLDAGFDSLSAIEFASAVSKKFEANLPRTLVFDFPSMQSIADKLKNEFDTVDVSPEAVPLPVTGHVISSASFMLPFSLKSAGMLQGLDCVTEVPFARLDLDECWDSEPRENFSYTKHAACMDNVEWFDANFFGITAAEARAMDPQQRLLLHVAVSANCNAVAKSRTAVFVGQANHDWSAHSHPVTSYIGAALSPAITSNRLSYHFQLQGPSMTIDTACSSSLVALTMARGKGMASSVVAGTHVMLSTLPFIGSCAATMLSKLGRCLTFDSSADGYCRGEGVAALILQTKNEKDVAKSAICEVNGSATNHNGRSASLTAPNGVVQESLFRTTLASASVERVDFVELHGTGTKLGDPVEAGAMMAVFKKSQNVNLSDNVITCGAVKSNVGHLEGSAGVAGLFKLISTLCQKAAPPNVHIRQLNPFLADVFFPNAGAVPASLFPDTLMSLDTTLGLHGAVSSFGFGGSNAQAILSPCNFNLTWEMAESKPNVFLPWMPCQKFSYSTTWRTVSCEGVKRFSEDELGTKIGNTISATKAFDGAHVVVMPCWTEKEAEDQVEDLKSHAGEMLRILQDCAKSAEAYCVVIAGSGAVAEACFSSLASMLRSAQCEGSVQVQAWFQTRTAGRPWDLCFCSPKYLPFLQWVYHKYMTCI